MFLFFFLLSNFYLSDSGFLFFFSLFHFDQIVLIFGTKIMFAVDNFLDISLADEIYHLSEFKYLQNKKWYPENVDNKCQNDSYDIKPTGLIVFTVISDSHECFLELVGEKKSNCLYR